MGVPEPNQQAPQILQTLQSSSSASSPMAFDLQLQTQAVQGTSVGDHGRPQKTFPPNIQQGCILLDERPKNCPPDTRPMKQQVWAPSDETAVALGYTGTTKPAEEFSASAVWSVL